MNRILLEKIFYPFFLIHREYRKYKLGLSASEMGKRIKTGEILVKMNIPQGEFFIDVRSHLLIAAIIGVYEEKTMRMVEKLKIDDGIIINIGANVGFYSIHLANCFLKQEILAIEPNPEAYKLLIKNINQNNLSNRIKAINICISNDSCSVPFYIIRGKSEYSSLQNIVHKSVLNEIQEVIMVKSLPLKDVVKEKKISLICMDVEGAEQLILKGCSEVIERDKPCIFCECNDALLKNFKSSSFELTNTLKELGYDIINADTSSRRINHPFNGNLKCTFIGRGN